MLPRPSLSAPAALVPGPPPVPGGDLASVTTVLPSTPPALAPKPLISHLPLIPGSDELKALCERARRRIEELRSEMGLELNLRGVARTGWSGSLWSGGVLSREKTWAWLREVAQKQYDEDFEYRKALHKGGIFEESNWSMNTAKHWCQVISLL